MTKSIFRKYFLKGKTMVSKDNAIKDFEQIMQNKNIFSFHLYSV